MGSGFKTLSAPALSKYKATVKWTYTKDGKKKLDKVWLYYTWDAEKAKDKKETNKDKAKSTSDSEDYNRKDWYPFAGKPKMLAVHVRARGKDGKKWWAYTGVKTTKLSVPAKPSVSCSVDDETGVVTFSVSATASYGADERYDTRITVTRTANRGTKSDVLDDYSNTGTSWSRSFNVADANILQAGEYIKIEAKVWNRGLRGDSQPSYASYTFAQPAMAQVNTPDDGNVEWSGTTADGGQAYVVVQTNSKSTAPVDSVQLQVLRSSAATTPEAAGALDTWADVDGAVDDWNCKGLTCPLADCWPDAGTRTWFRLKTVHGNYTVYGKPAMLGYFEPPKTEVVASGRAEILVDAQGTLTRSGDDGKSAVIVVAFDDADDNTGTEISWSKFADAWMSTDEPDAFNVTWEDGTSQSTSQVLPDSSTLYVRGLDQNVPYYFKARRYLVDAEGDTIFGAYNGPVTVVPVSAPASVVLRASSQYVPRGQGVTLTWTFDSDAAQEWYDVDGGSKHWSGHDALGSLSIGADELAGSDTWEFAVTMSTGGAAVTSEPVTVHIVDAPTCSLSLASSTLAAQPLSLAVSCDKPGCAITASVTADAGESERPDTVVEQAEGDVVWGAYIAEPEWTESSGMWTASVTLPGGLELLDECSYTVSAGVTDLSTGLSAQAAPASFAVAWSHQADGGTATATSDADELSVELVTEAPEGYAMGDVCDVYRVTPDGVQRITPDEGVAYGSTVTDAYAPFGHADLRYYIATRTQDGDVDWEDVAYELPCKDMVLDWDGNRLVLRYNPSMSDAFAKDFETRAHMGQRTASGYWGETVARTASISGSLLLSDTESQELLRALARYNGPVFVRTPNGAAYAANVDVGEVAESWDSGALDVSLDVTEVSSAEFAAAVEQPEWTGGAVTSSRGQVYDVDGGYPLLSWTWLGYHGSTGYTYDAPNQRVVDSTGTVKTDWTWDGLVLEDDNGDEVELSEEAS